MLGLGSAWGIDLAESGLKAVKVGKHKGRPVVEDFVIIRYADLTSDRDVQKEDLIKLAVRQLLPKVGKSKAVVGIPSENVLSRFISLPPVSKARIRDIVQYEARQQIPFDLSEVLWDFQRVRKDLVPGEEIDIGLFAVRREHVDGYLAELKSLGGNLQGLQISPLAAYNFVRVDIAPEKPLIVVDMGARSTDLIILEGDKFWVRNVRIAGRSFTQTLQRKFNISFEDAENVKKHMERSKHRARIFDALMPVAQELVSEIQRSIGYYKSLSKDAKFEEILILGDAFKTYGLSRFMSERLQYRVHAAEETHNVGVIDGRREAFLKALPGLATAAGLALQGAGFSAVSVDLLPETFVVKRELEKKKISALAAAALLWLSAGFLWYSQSRLSSGIEQFARIGAGEIKQATEKIREWDKVKALIKNPVEVPDLLALGRGREIWAVWLDGLSRAVPGSFRIDDIRWEAMSKVRISAPSTAPGGGSPSSFWNMDVGSQSAPGKWLNFVARSEEDTFKELLKPALERATIYPEKVRMFKQVLVSDATQDRSSARTAGGPAGTARVGVMATVSCELFSEADLEKARRDALAKMPLGATPAALP